MKEDDDTGEEEGVTAGGGVSGDVGRAGIQGTGLRWWLQSGERMPSEAGVGGAEPALDGVSCLEALPCLPEQSGSWVLRDGGWSPRENILSSLMFL